MRSLFSGVSGLRIHQTKMDVIANNIANVNTVGYKGNRVTFSDLFSQTLSGASRANEATGRGGVNSRQIGLGVGLASIDKLMGRGATQVTDRQLDAMIDGDGFFIVGDATGNYFTRAGAFTIDGDGNLVLASNGMRVMGWDAVPDVNNPGQFIINSGVVGPLEIYSENKQVMPATSTTSVAFVGNINAITNPDPISRTMEIFDTLGRRFVIDVQYELIGDEWSFQMFNLAYPDGDRDNPVYLDITVGGAQIDISVQPYDAENPPADASQFIEIHQLSFNTNGFLEEGFENLALVFDVVPGALSPDAELGGSFVNPNDNNTAGNNGVLINFSSLTQLRAESSSVRANVLNGNSMGDLIDMSIGPDGIISGIYSNGERRSLGQIPVAIFSNPEGLDRMGGNLFRATLNSGNFDGVGVEVGAGGGQMLGGSLEMSNVDLAGEFTEMITTQRGFQASSRAITTSDDMLQELVNLKR